jgi:hypothetical protein
LDLLGGQAGFRAAASKRVVVFAAEREQFESGLKG